MVRDFSTGHVIMQNIDRFFDTYDRVLPRWFADAVVTALLLLPIVWLMS
jgi:hypothetical protein